MNTTTPASLQAFSANAVKAGRRELIEKMKDTDSAVQIQLLQKQLLSLCLQDQEISYQDQYPRERRLDGDEQDLPKTGDHKYSTVIKALDYMSDEQYKSLKTFYEHLIANYFPTVKLSKIKGSKWTSLVTHPAPALIHFYYNVAPAYIIVQDLTQCGESKAMMIMNTLEDIMGKFDLGLKIVNRRSISKKKKKSKRGLEKSQKSNKSVLWKTKTHLMLSDNDAASTMRKVEDCKLYRTLVAYFKSSDQGTSSSEEHRARRLDGTSSRDRDIPSLDKTHEVKSDQGTAEHDIPSLDQIHEVKSDQGTLSSAEHDIPSLDRIQEVTSDQGTSSSAEHDILSLDSRNHEPKLPLTPKRTEQVEEMECEIIQLRETVRSLEDKFDESKRKLRAKEAIGVKSTETQTSKEEEEEETKLKMSDLELTLSRLQEELRRSKEKNVEAEKSFKNMATYYKQQLLNMSKKNEDLKDKTNALERKLQNKEEYIDVILVDLGRALVERDTLIKGMKAHGTAQSSPVEVTSSSSQTSEMSSSPEAPTRIRGAEAVTERDEHLTANSEATEQNSGSNEAAVAVQESQAEANSRDTISSANIPTTTVERGLYVNYKVLLLLINRMLLAGDVIKFKEWACSILPVDVTASVDDIFLELDRSGVISAVNLEKLREFFEKILRIDLVHMIDYFIVGDYSYLRYTSNGTPRLNNPGNTTRVIDPPQRAMTSSRTSLQSSVLTSGKHSLHSQARSSEVEESYVPPQSKRPNMSAVAPSNCRTKVSGGTAHQPVRGQLVTNVPGSKNTTSNGKPCTLADSARNNNSKTQAPNDNSDDDDDDDDDDSRWLCSHYKRRSYVKFDCCDKYWPCHRCHNNESKCGQKKLKSRDTKFLKCVSCGREQQFSSQSQFCNNCQKRFAKYFCAICKYLTGTDDNPYHCEKCGICRIHSDRSFHCDVCGVCLDVQLRGNHKCGAGSAHDKCCICLEDAFTGCQILPCSHKVHKECATQMIRSGITRCPICWESFTHKLERRNLPPLKKPPGK